MPGSRSPSPRREDRRDDSPRRGGDRSRSRSPDRAHDNGSKRKTGTAARWNEKGFGFIKPHDGSEDVFCHFSAIKDGNCLREGSEVEFEVRFDENKGKNRAEDVTGGVYEDRSSRDFGGRSGGECYDFKQGRCHRGDSCKFSHGQGGGGRDRYDNRRSGDRYDDRRGGDRYDDRRGGGRDYDRYERRSRERY
ncbi:unnamed protein product [Aphanomyces euteiches]|nr:hypothetical protein Ae201684P_002926 [Aphanomyces euteiches]KAH9098939.1 hypothetical protein LEN26_016488 [Aphanomyces euteiches]KAH9105662.1 hypothetical protein AeMF1_018580 [Aphanomyces euteiches]KAH9116266.1 hypothetical protein AeMF1_009797 [Aphanomyces euteiches]KAH9149810.1 hypothetical protein AeRB84_007239 [Aphanomyces euteiches]